jgi:CheY-like chemotaxis protein
VPRHRTQRSIVSTSLIQPDFGRNSKFGAMFVWSGSFCLALWACASLTVRPGPALGDFAPGFVYFALAIAGIALITSDAGRRQPRNPRAGRFSETIDRLAAREADQYSAGRIQTRSCRVMTIGPLAPIKSILSLLGRSIVVEHTEATGIALHKLVSLSPADIPDVLIMPWWLPFVKSSDLIRAIKSDRTTKPIHIIVWGANIPIKEIQSLYNVGAKCVIPMPFDENMAQALREFCTTIGDSKVRC